MRKAMDRLAVGIDPCAPGMYEGGVYFLVHVQVNGESLPSILDVDEFFRSLSEGVHPRRNVRAGPKRYPVNTARRLPILNCSCGIFDCGGYCVDVTLTPEALIWENLYRSKEPRREPCVRWRYAFPWNNVSSIAEELLAAIYTAQAQSPNGEVRYGATGIELTERLPLYRERYAVMPTYITDEQ